MGHLDGQDALRHVENSVRTLTVVAMAVSFMRAVAAIAGVSAEQISDPLLSTTYTAN
jgi:hypothetical protein